MRYDVALTTGVQLRVGNRGELLGAFAGSGVDAVGADCATTLKVRWLPSNNEALARPSPVRVWTCHLKVWPTVSCRGRVGESGGHHRPRPSCRVGPGDLVLGRARDGAPAHRGHAHRRAVGRGVTGVAWADRYVNLPTWAEITSDETRAAVVDRLDPPPVGVVVRRHASALSRGTKGGVHCVAPTGAEVPSRAQLDDVPVSVRHWGPLVVEGVADGALFGRVLEHAAGLASCAGSATWRPAPVAGGCRRRRPARTRQ